MVSGRTKGPRLDLLRVIGQLFGVHRPSSTRCARALAASLVGTDAGVWVWFVDPSLEPCGDERDDVYVRVDAAVVANQMQIVALVGECRSEWRRGPEVLGAAVGRVVDAEGSGLDGHEARPGVAVPAEGATWMDHVLNDVDVGGALDLDADLPELGRVARVDVGLGSGVDPACEASDDRRPRWVADA